MEGLGVSAGYSVSDVDTDLVSYRQHDLRGGFRYEYLQKSFLFAEVGNSWQRFSRGESASNAFWQAGVSKSFDGVEATVETLVQYVDDPLAVSTKQTSHRASLAADLPRGGFGLSSTYVKYLDTLTGGNGRKKGEIRGFWRFLASPRLQTLLSLTGDRVSRRTPDDYPYHVSATAGADYLLNHGVTASVSVSYIDYRHNWDSSAGARRTNRVILGVKKLF